MHKYALHVVVSFIDVSEHLPDAFSNGIHIESMERTHPGPDLFDEPLNRIRQVAGEPSQTNAAGRDLNQFGQVRDVHQQYHCESVHGCCVEAY